MTMHPDERSTARPFIVAVALLVGVLGAGALAGDVGVGAQEGPKPPEPGLTTAEEATVARALDRLTPPGKKEPVVGATSEAAYQGAVGTFRTCVQGAVGRGSTRTVATLEVTSSAFTADRFRIDTVFSLRSAGMDVGQTVAAQDALGAAQESCYATHLAATELAYQAGLLADEAYVQRSTDAFLGCVGAGGVDTSGVTNPRTLLTGLGNLDESGQSVVSDCADAYPSISSVPEPLAGGS